MRIRCIGASDNSDDDDSAAAQAYILSGVDTQLKAELRLRMYVRCSECASLIDLAEGNRPQRDIEAADMMAHKFEGHSIWLELLDIPDAV